TAPCRDFAQEAQVERCVTARPVQRESGLSCYRLSAARRETALALLQAFGGLPPLPHHELCLGERHAMHRRLQMRAKGRLPPAVLHLAAHHARPVTLEAKLPLDHRVVGSFVIVSRMKVSDRAAAG